MVDPVAQLFQDAASTTGNDGATASIVSSDATGKLYVVVVDGVVDGAWMMLMHNETRTSL